MSLPDPDDDDLSHPPAPYPVQLFAQIMVDDMGFPGGLPAARAHVLATLRRLGVPDDQIDAREIH